MCQVILKVPGPVAHSNMQSLLKPCVYHPPTNLRHLEKALESCFNTSFILQMSEAQRYRSELVIDLFISLSLCIVLDPHL